MLPDESILLDYENSEMEPSRTYRLNFESQRLGDEVDAIEAVKQAVMKVLFTNKGMAIYSDYGFEDLIGVDEIYFRAEMKRRITETLLQDDRILSVKGFTLQIESDQAVISFTADTIFGEASWEVTKNV